MRERERNMEASQLMFLLLLLFLHLCGKVYTDRPFTFNTAIAFNSSVSRRSLAFEEGLFAWPLHDVAAVANLSFQSPDANPERYLATSASYLCYVTNGTQSGYVLSIVITGVEGGSRIENGMIVWMANRDNPARGGPPSLAIEQPDKRLVLRSGEDRTEVWGVNISGATHLQLQGDGNLLLFSNSTLVWQSFDYPTDSLALGQVLGQGARLVSRTSATDLSSGPYSFVVDHQLRFSFYYSQDDNPGSVRYIRTHPPPLPPSCSNLSAGQKACAMVDFALGLSLSMYCNSSCVNSIRSETTWMNSTESIVAPHTTAALSNDTVPLLRLLNSGDFVVYQCGRLSAWTPPQAFFSSEGMDACQLPTRCNRFTTCFPLNNTCSPGCTTDNGDSCTIADDSLPPPRPTCRNVDLGWKMGTITGRTYSPNEFTVASINTSDAQQCKERCYDNCSCTASFYEPQRGCFVVTEQLLYLTHNTTPSYVAFIKIPSSSSSPSAITSMANRNRQIALAVGSVAILILVSAVVVAAIMVKRQRKRGGSNKHSATMKSRLSKSNPDLEEGDEEEEDLDDDFLHDSLHTVTRYSYPEIQYLTENFSVKLGSGGFGSVYEGLLVPGTQKVAVKRLDSMSGQGSKEFRAEVAIMAGIHHRNLVDLLGFCAQGFRRVLVYEHMPNGSLDRWLFSNGEASLSLTWPMRLRIAIGVANGLAYLHEGCSKKIIHLDVKPQNILLDHSFNAKVGDFGLSRLLSREESFAMTTMRGTPGYLAPEWLLDGGITEKIDVFSFGMVLLELISGRKNYIPQLSEPDKRYFPAWGLDKVKVGRDLELLDPRLLTYQRKDVVLEEQARRMIKVAFMCVQEDPQNRPKMSCVAKMLEGGESVPPISLLDHNIARFLQSRAGTTASSDNKSMTYTSIQTSVSSR